MHIRGNTAIGNEIIANNYFEQIKDILKASLAGDELIFRGTYVKYKNIEGDFPVNVISIKITD